MVAHNSVFGMRFEVACERPLFMFRAVALTLRARLRGIRWLRDFLLTAQPPFLTRRGIRHRNSERLY